MLPPAKLSLKKRGRPARRRKKALAHAQVIIANQTLQKKADPPAPDPPSSADPPVSNTPTKNVLTTTQWLSVISIIISVVGIYYKREEIKRVFTKEPPLTPSPSPVDFTPPPERKGGIRSMD